MRGGAPNARHGMRVSPVADGLTEQQVHELAVMAHLTFDPNPCHWDYLAEDEQRRWELVVTRVAQEVRRA